VQFTRVVVGVTGSAGSLQALRFATDLARFHEATLIPVHAWMPPGGEVADRRYRCPELQKIWERSAWDRLWAAVDLALGGTPTDVRFAPEVVRSEPGKALTLLACQQGDLLVIGTGRHGAIRRMLRCHVARYCLAHATCPVVAVPPSQLADALHGLRGFLDRHRLHPEDAELRI